MGGAVPGVRNAGRRAARRHGRSRAGDAVLRAAGLDPIGSVTSFLAVGAVALVVSEGHVHGWSDSATLGLGLLGAAMIVAFIAWERRHPRPLLEVRLLAEPRFGTASVALFVTFFAHFAMFCVAIQYMVYAVDMGIVESALGVAPPAAGFLLIPFGPWVARRFGRRRAMCVSLSVMIAARSRQSSWPAAWSPHGGCGSQRV